jgi:hypothetical protein
LCAKRTHCFADFNNAYFGRAEARGFAPLDRQKSIADLSIAIDNGALQHLTIAEQLGFWLIKEGKYTEAINRICQALGDATNPTVT